ncbi:MAG: glutathione S-transferase family protein [Rhizobiaceae bacterium]|nr:glutathione S-transferase family protein [Rhizobiaceae bacterium]
MERPRLFGAAYSVYVRIARLALIEKGVDHELVPVDVFAAEGLPDWYRERHPFGKIPAFEHGALQLFETAAIARYVDEAFDGPALQPADAARRAVVNQAVGMLDAYAYRALVWDIYVERVSVAHEGGVPDEAKIARALPLARTCLATLSGMAGTDGRWLLGKQMTLADLHAAPMIDYFLQAPEGRDLMKDFPRLETWWSAVSERAAFEATAP